MRRVPLFLALVTFVTIQMSASAQVPDSQFTRAELIRAVSFFVAAPEAERLVEGMLSDQIKPPHPRPDSSNIPGALTFSSVEGMTFDEDMLLILSFVSAETERKVDKYRDSLRRRGFVADKEESEWQTRRARFAESDEAKRWLAQGSQGP